MELQHFGIKGMKWGVRKRRREDLKKNKLEYKNIKSNLYNQYESDVTKYDRKIGATRAYNKSETSRAELIYDSTYISGRRRIEESRNNWLNDKSKADLLENKLSDYADKRYEKYRNQYYSAKNNFKKNKKRIKKEYRKKVK